MNHITHFFGFALLATLIVVLVRAAFELSRREIGSPEYKAVVSKFWRNVTCLVIFFVGFFLGQISLALDLAFTVINRGQG